MNRKEWWCYISRRVAQTSNLPSPSDIYQNEHTRVVL
jgi:hypothetical protein